MGSQPRGLKVPQRPFRVYPHPKRATNCRLLVDTTFESDSADPDAYIPWDHVRLVDSVTDDLLNCPICMDVPTFPRLGQCGHLYCLSCLSLYRQSSSKCAVCNEWLGSKEIRAARIQQTDAVKAGGLVDFRLIQFDGMTATPVGSHSLESSNRLISTSASGWWFNPVARISRGELIHFYTSELREINRLISEGKWFEESEALGIFMAKESVSETLKSLGDSDDHKPSSNSTYSQFFIPQNDLIFENLKFPENNNLTFFYQSQTGAPVFLDPLWTKALLIESTGSSDWSKAFQLPPVLTLPITRVEGISVNDQTRKRYRLLGHLPSGTSAAVCDAELGSLLSESTRNFMSRSIERRERQDKERELQDIKDEKRREKYFERADREQRELFSVNRAPVVLPRPEDFVPLGGVVTTPREVNPGTQGGSGFSFAQIASRPAMNSVEQRANGELLDSFLNSQEQPRTGKKKKNILRIAG